MAAFSLTASGVKVAKSAIIGTVNAKEVIVAGQAITAEGYVVDPEDPLKLDVIGIAVTSAALNDKVVYCGDGAVLVSDTLTPCRQIIAAPSGQLQYDDDLLSADYYVMVGYTTDANSIQLLVQNSEFLKP